MFLDNVVIAGVVTVGLMVLFFAGLGFFIWKDSQKRNKSRRVFLVHEHARHFGRLRSPIFLPVINA